MYTVNPLGSNKSNKKQLKELSKKMSLVLALEKRQVSAKRKGKKSKQPTATSKKRSTQRAGPRAKLGVHPAALHVLQPGLVHKTPAGLDGPAPATSIPGNMVATTILTVGSASNGLSLVVFKPSMHNETGAKNVAIQSITNNGTAPVIAPGVYARNQLMSLSDMDPEQSSYKMNSHHVTISYAGNPLNRTGAVYVVNPTQHGELDWFRAELDTYVTSGSLANFTALCNRLKISPIAKEYIVNQMPTIQITTPTRQNWTHEGGEQGLDSLAFSKFGSYTPGNNLGPLPNFGNMKLNGSEVFVVIDANGGGGASAISFALKNEVSAEMHTSTRPAFMTPALHHDLAASKSLHDLTVTLMNHNRTADAHVDARQAVRGGGGSTLSKVGSFLYKNRGTEEKLAMALL